MYFLLIIFQDQRSGYLRDLTTDGDRLSVQAIRTPETNAIHLEHNLDIAYDLIEIRTGDHGQKPVRRNGQVPVGSIEALRAEAVEVLGKAFGKDGERKRANVAKLRERVLTAWDEDGSSRQDAQRLLDDIST